MRDFVRRPYPKTFSGKGAIRVHDAGMPYCLHGSAPPWWNRDLIMLEPFIPNLDMFRWNTAWRDCQSRIAINLGLTIAELVDVRGWSKWKTSDSCYQGWKWLKGEMDYPYKTAGRSQIDPPAVPLLPHSLMFAPQL